LLYENRQICTVYKRNLMITGLLLVVIAAVLQGVFLVPMSFTRQWAWEHVWLMFSVFGMLVFNWAMALILLPSPWAIFTAVPRQELIVLVLFGAGWGVGAVLFGLGMDKLGLALGYPIIMGLNAAVGTLLPLLSLVGGELLVGRSMYVLIGTAIGIAGVIVSSIAGARRESTASTSGKLRAEFVSGLAIAIAAGCLSALPNLGMAFGTHTILAARESGASASLAGDAVWFLFFTFGGLVNCAYCVALMIRRRNFQKLFAGKAYCNFGWTSAMGLMWIGSFYLYGTGASKMGSWGAVIGWPVLISLSIGVAVLCGWWRGEWKNAPSTAKRLLWQGLVLIVIAVVVIPFGKLGK
jgi:L-rhamnose-H+ transport protein